MYAVPFLRMNKKKTAFPLEGLFSFLCFKKTGTIKKQQQDNLLLSVLAD